RLGSPVRPPVPDRAPESLSAKWQRCDLRKRRDNVDVTGRLASRDPARPIDAEVAGQHEEVLAVLLGVRTGPGDLTLHHRGERRPVRGRVCRAASRAARAAMTADTAPTSAAQIMSAGQPVEDDR